MNWLGGWQRLRREGRQAIELFVIPWSLARLPWSWAYACMRALARFNWLYRDATQAAWSKAQNLGWTPIDSAHWCWQRRLVTLMDHTDHYLGLSRGDDWMTRHLRVEGQWPEPETAAWLATFHWGTGYWGLRHLKANGVKAHALVSALDPSHYAGQSVLFAYAKSRTQHVAEALGTSTLEINSTLRPVLKALKSKEALIALPDVPADQAAASMPVSLLGRTVWVPRGMFRLAVEHRIPVWFNYFDLDLVTGQRTLIIRALGVFDDQQALASALFAELQSLIEQRPAFWHLWAQADRFIQNPQAPLTA